ncbi:MAG: DUF4062 domain-containing protein [Bacteroidales bacterium]|nr:DUF4062 domain-containing protein [Bacteroidales bacterium]
MKNIFISSTFSDLIDYRKHIEDVIKRYGDLFTGMEYFGARSISSKELCIKEIKNCDIIILIIGIRYGSKIDTVLSYTEMEYNTALSEKKKIYPFIIDSDNAKFNYSDFESNKINQEALKNFIKKIKQNYTVEKFCSPSDLATKVAIVLGKNFPKMENYSFNAFEELFDRLSKDSYEYDVYSIGANNVDRYIKLDVIQPDHECEIEMNSNFYGGGSGSNTLAVLGNLGVNVGISGIVVKDNYGNFLEKDLASFKIDTSELIKVDTSKTFTGRTTILIDNYFARTILVEPGINNEYSYYLNQYDNFNTVVNKCFQSRIIHLSSFSSESEILTQSQVITKLQKTKLVSFTPGQLYCNFGLLRIKPILERTNIIFFYKKQLETLIKELPEYEDSLRLEDKINLLFLWKKRNHLDEPLIIVVKNRNYKDSFSEKYVNVGIGRYQLESYHQSSSLSELPEHIPTMDTTGAGDSLVGGMLYGLLNCEDLKKCANYGFMTALNASKSLGGRTELYTKNELSKSLKKYFKYHINQVLD